jgi:hypothetical protein
MSEALRQANERIRRFERLGGVDLSGLSRDEKAPILAEVRTGLFELRRAIFTYKCPMCANVLRSPQEMEPLCSGPSWTDDHPLEIMERVPETQYT